MINQINELNQIYVNQYNCMNNTLDMHIFSCYLTTVYSYLIKYPEITFSSIVKKGFVEIFIQLTDLINYFTYYSTQQSKVSTNNYYDAKVKFLKNSNHLYSISLDYYPGNMLDYL